VREGALIVPRDARYSALAREIVEDPSMPSPFPGMDPYIEACGLWADFHNHFIEEIAAQLAEAAPQRYVVRTGERSYLVLVDIEEEHRETFIEIYEADPGQRLVTTIEVLSPSNKRPGTEGWDLYQRKRQSILLGDVSLVEIDLLRGGQRPPMLDPWPDSPYTLMVARARHPQSCRVWEAHFRQPLPPIPVPLAKPDPDLILNLQPLIDTIYRRFRYGQSIRYTAELTPPLRPEKAAWCRQLLQARSSD
jgi:hypothetical protein